MPCYKPLNALYGPEGPTFNPKAAFGPRFPIQLPCGRCLGCRLERAKEWALRCSHEAQMHDKNSFITLTYDPDHLPQDGNLDTGNPSHLQKFIRSLRKRTGEKIRYFACGEYGNICCEHGGWINEEVPNTAQCKTCRTGRPHYHILLFGYDFPDRYLWSTKNGKRYYRSPLLDKTWGKGFADITDVTFESAGYVARYSLKKQNGEYAEREYRIIDFDTGEIVGYRKPPFLNMSLKPGIGETWYQKFKDDLFPHDYAITPDGRQMPVPTYYRRLLEKEDPRMAEQLRKARVEKAKLNPDNDEARLETREFVQAEKAKKLKRTL